MKHNDLGGYAPIPDRVSQAYTRSALNLKEEPMRKRKVSMALVMAMLLILAAVTAVAAALLSGREFVQEVMQPKAQESLSAQWSETEVQELLRIAGENGLTLSESQQALLLARGGYDKEELMRLFVKLDLGQDPGTWSIEDQAWYGQMLMDIGLYAENHNTVPEEGEATEAQMLQVLQTYIHDRYDPDAPLTDETVYRQLALSWGVVPLIMKEQTSTDALFEASVNETQAASIVRDGDLVVITAGVPVGMSGTTNILKAHVVGDPA